MDACVMHYIGPADVGDVLHEQIDYLLAHGATHKEFRPSCPECARLAVAKDLLLTPFLAGGVRIAPGRSVVDVLGSILPH